MVKYDYDPLSENFKRVDNRGRPLEINIIEARRIVALKNLGYKVPRIYRDIEMELPQKISVTTLRTFIKNYEQGNISIEGEFPAPKKILDELDNEERYNALECRIEELERRLDEMESADEKSASYIDKVKGWKIWRQ